MVNFPITVILGGARSGKSSFAEKLAENSGKDLFYIATAEAFDDEMTDRIHIHRSRRNDRWQTLEEPLEIVRLIEETASPDRIVLIDCLTLWLSNIMCAERDVLPYLVSLISCLENVKGPVILVSNEVGLGIVPENSLARKFRDEAGRLNVVVASVATDVLFMASGLPMPLKRDGKASCELWKI